MRVEDRLNIARETEARVLIGAFAGIQDGLELRDAFFEGDRRRAVVSDRVGDHRALRFMAADAGESLARLESRPAAHRLHDVAVGVEELEVDGGSRGNFEIGGSVLFDGNFSQDVFDVPRPVRDRGRHRTQSAPRGPAVSVAANIGDAEFKGDDAKRLDDAAFDTFKARPFVNVLHVIFSRRFVQIDLRRTYDGLVALGE